MVGLTAAILGGILGSLLVRTVWSSGFGSGSPVPLEVLIKTSDRLNKMLPMMVDRDTQLVSTSALPGAFVYQFRFVNLSADGLNPDALAEVEQRQRERVVNLACTTPETREHLLNLDVKMRYQYSDADGRQVMRFEITSSDCAAVKS